MVSRRRRGKDNGVLPYHGRLFCPAWLERYHGGFSAEHPEKKLIQKLARQIQLNVLIESEETIDFLNTHIETEMGIWIKVDVGYHRTGIRCNDGNTLRLQAQQIRNTPHRLEGLLTHAGQAYQARGKSQLIKIYKDSVRKINHARDRLAADGFSPLKISYGDTPTCSAVDHFEGVDEIRPGNFVFYDIMQWQIGSCREEDIACALVCPVVAKHSERQELLIHGGAVHLSKEFILDEKGQKIFGYLAHWDGTSWGAIISDSWVSALSQEHGIIHAGSNLIQNVKVGDMLAILPIHSCLVMDLMSEFTLVSEI